MIRSCRRLSARIGRWPRLCAAGVCLVLAISSAVDAAPATRSTRRVPVLVAAHDLAVGATVRVVDIRTRSWPADLVPHTALRNPAQATGRRLTGALSSGEVVTVGRLLGGGPVAGVPPGRVAVMIAVDSDSATLVRPGERVDVITVALPEDGSRTTSAITNTDTIARAALLLAVLPGTTDGTSAPSARLVLAVRKTEALRVARERGTKAFTVLRLGP